VSLKATLEAISLLDDATVDGPKVENALRSAGVRGVSVKRVRGERGFTDFVKAVIPGKSGRRNGGNAPTLGVIGRLGGIGARPEMIGLVSDGDGACAAVAAAIKLGSMSTKGDVLPGDVVVATHICPCAPTQPHEPVPFMGSPVDMATMNELEVDSSMDAVLSIDTTKGNRVINHRDLPYLRRSKKGTS
jgi:hypothetical protein